MHVLFCSPEEPTPLLFLDRLVPFKANEQLQRCLKSTGGSSWKSFFLHSSTHNQHFFPSPLLISSPFPFLKTSREVSHLGGPCSNYRKFSLPEDVQPHPVWLALASYRNIKLFSIFLSEELFGGVGMKEILVLLWMLIYVRNYPNHEACLERKQVHMHTCV